MFVFDAIPIVRFVFFRTNHIMFIALVGMGFAFLFTTAATFRVGAGLFAVEALGCLVGASFHA